MLTPIECAQEQRCKRLLLFANNPWYIQWAEDEDLGGTNIYDTYVFPFLFALPYVTNPALGRRGRGRSQISRAPRRAPAFGKILFGVYGQDEGVAGERSLRKAVEELLKMWRLCRTLPDKGGVGAKAMWGARWVEKGWGSVGGKNEEVKNEGEEDPAELCQASAEQQLASVGEEAEAGLNEDTKPEVDNQ